MDLVFTNELVILFCVSIPLSHCFPPFIVFFFLYCQIYVFKIINLLYKRRFLFFSLFFYSLSVYHTLVTFIFTSFFCLIFAFVLAFVSWKFSILISSWFLLPPFFLNSLLKFFLFFPYISCSLFHLDFCFFSIFSYHSFGSILFASFHVLPLSPHCVCPFSSCVILYSSFLPCVSPPILFLYSSLSFPPRTSYLLSFLAFPLLISLLSTFLFLSSLLIEAIITWHLKTKGEVAMRHYFVP